MTVRGPLGSSRLWAVTGDAMFIPEFYPMGNINETVFIGEGHMCGLRRLQIPGMTQCRERREVFP